MDSKTNNNTRTSGDYARQQEDIRANQVHGESSLHRDTEQPELNRSSEDREKAQGVEKGSGKPLPKEDLIAPKHDKGYDIFPTATNVKL